MIPRSLLVALGLFFAAVSSAQVPGLSDVLLTPERVKSVVAAFPQMRKQLAAMHAAFDPTGSAEDVAARLQELAQLGPAQGQLNSTAAALGFADFTDWLNTTDAVFVAHAFARNPGLDAQVRGALDQIDRQASLSPAQKEEMKAAIRQSMGTLQSMRPPEQNLAAVAPYRDQIDAILEE